MNLKRDYKQIENEIYKQTEIDQIRDYKETQKDEQIIEITIKL
jgi:hypothetical protein